MLRHLLKLTWRRKARNLMLSLEILLAFAIVFGIAAFALRNLQLYREPIGFDGDATWSVQMSTGAGGDDTIPADVYDRIRRGLRELPEVRDVGFAAYQPYTRSTWSTSYQSPQTHANVKSDIMEADDGFAATVGLKLARGRWFSAADDGAAAAPVVVNRRLAAGLFPGMDALGRTLDNQNNDGPRTLRIVGIVDDFRPRGPLSAPTGFILTRFTPYAGKSRAHAIFVQVAAGTPRAFEARLNRQLKLIRNDWSYQIAPLPVMRASMMESQLMPLFVASVIAAFMLLMVAFGLFGVLWQNTTRRIPEIGLRRAIGARAADIYRQIVAEQLLLSSVAIAVGLLLLVQLPLTGALGEALNWTVFAGAAALSMAVIYLLSLLCALYPGWRASRLAPAAALHYE